MALHRIVLLRQFVQDLCLRNEITKMVRVHTGMTGNDKQWKSSVNSVMPLERENDHLLDYLYIVNQKSFNK